MTDPPRAVPANAVDGTLVRVRPEIDDWRPVIFPCGTRCRRRSSAHGV